MNSQVSLHSENSEIVRRVSQWITQGAGMPLSDGDYAAVVTRRSSLFDHLCESGILAVIPSPSHCQVGALRRTPCGVLPTSLTEVFGIADELFHSVITQLAPYCGGCACLATPPGGLEQMAIPQTGFVSLSVVDDEADASLRERCEWLGSERALVGKRLLRVEEIVSDGGEPVIAVVQVGSDITQLHKETSRWFARGGGALRLVHFTARAAEGTELGVLNGSWCCPKCAQVFPEPSRTLLDNEPSCSTCGGKGWLLGDTARLVACRDCDGFGLLTDMARYQLYGVPLRHVATLSFQEFATKVTLLPELLRNRLQMIIEGGFGRYPLGTPVGLLSQGERALLALVCGRLSGFKDVEYLIDAAVGDPKKSISSQATRLCGVAVAQPQQVGVVGQQTALCGNRDLVLRDIRQGCLNLPEVRLPLGELSVVLGPIGSGKSLLLSVVAARFAKRRKLAHQNSFGELKRCTVVTAEVASNQTVLEALGLADDFAYEIARTRRAQELGVLHEDLVLPKSRYRCQVCAENAAEEDLCNECLGAVYDWRISGLSVAGQTVGQLLTTPLERLDTVVWTGELLERVVRTCPVELRSRVTLGSSLAQLPRPEQRLLSVWGGLVHVLHYAERQRRKKGGAPLEGDLVLVDGPRVMPVTHAREVEKLLLEINSMGATVIYADIPESLEFLGSCVLQLEARENPFEQRTQEVHLDARYAQVCSQVKAAAL